MLLFAVFAAAALVLPALFQDGMFADGILYASVSKNMAEGSGSFWNAHFSPFLHDQFHEQPPLVFFLQSLFFRVFSGIYPERVYDFVLALIDGWLIVRLWKTVFVQDEKQSALGAWPLFLFFISPVVFWAFTNNIIEISMAAFVLASVTELVTALAHGKQPTLRIVLAALWLIGASLCKGPQGLFPLVAPAILWLCMRKTIPLKKAIMASLVLFGITAAFYAVLLQYEPAKNAYIAWYKNRIVHTFIGTNNTTGTHFSMLYDLFLNLLPPAGIAAVVFFFGRKTAANEGNNRSWSLAFLLIALSGTLPLLVTKEQRPFYLTTAMPFYALSIAALTAPALAALVEKTAPRPLLWKITGISSCILIAGTIVVTILLAGSPKRDGDLIADIHSITKIVGKGTEMGCNTEAYNTDAVVNYFIRYSNIAINQNTSLVHSPYYVAWYGEAPRMEYRKVGLKTRVVQLYMRRK